MRDTNRLRKTGSICIYTSNVPAIKSGTFDVSKKIMVKEKKVRVFEYGRVIDNFHIDAFFFIDRCPQFTIKRGNVRQYLYGLCSNEIRSSREKKKKKNIRFTQQNDSVCTKPYRRFDTKDDRHEGVQEIRCTSTNRPDQLTAKTAVAIHVMMDHGLPWFTGPTSLLL